MNLADAVVSGGVAMSITLISYAVKALFARDRDKAAAHRDHAEAEARYQESWREDYDHAYNQLKSQCDECDRKLERFAAAFYGLIDDLEEQIMPMLMLPDADNSQTRAAVRVCMRRARDRVRDASER